MLKDATNYLKEKTIVIVLNCVWEIKSDMVLREVVVIFPSVQTFVGGLTYPIRTLCQETTFFGQAVFKTKCSHYYYFQGYTTF